MKIYLILGIIILSLGALVYYQAGANGKLAAELETIQKTLEQSQEEIDKLGTNLDELYKDRRKAVIERRTRDSSPATSVDALERMIEERSQ